MLHHRLLHQALQGHSRRPMNSSSLQTRLHRLITEAGVLEVDIITITGAEGMVTPGLMIIALGVQALHRGREGDGAVEEEEVVFLDGASSLEE